ncbi:DNA polymerase III subunit epsilon [Albimonas sp. CAU 1670]|uniref:DNA polymerase III subunit epsilon n=1 Tax=Albimonas sp. CAU 1670 TaxID=3032599 RepID=UPI0023D9B3A5|nr:DNA polymerase III subunit epsilon [Albimonas sp. CAU 1670]MDF2231195.1 DNA polymerase III subunit epsilon [Albimonas sp. CAU 1670]
MRELVMDTETTGFEPKEGHRLVELGAVELFNHVPTGRFYHQYINPERDVPIEAFNVHGLSQDFLSKYPTFDRVVDAFLEFLGDAKLVIHNAEFDMRFINAELGWLKRPPLPMDRAIDTLAIARKRYPGSPNTLDALCRRFGIDNSGREKHGALLDSELLAEVYLELIGGRQPDFGLATASGGSGANAAATGAGYTPPPRPRPLRPRLTEAEASAHAAFVAEMGDAALWTKLSGG